MREVSVLQVNLHKFMFKAENLDKISRIIAIEFEITEAIRNGHKCHWGDEYRDKRNEMIRLRKELIEFVKQ